MFRNKTKCRKKNQNVASSDDNKVNENPQNICVDNNNNNNNHDEIQKKNGNKSPFYRKRNKKFIVGHVTSKINLVKSESIAQFSQLQDQLKDLMDFSDWYLNFDQLCVDRKCTKSLCDYFEGLINQITEFHSTLDQLDRSHPEIERMRNNSKQLKKLMITGEDLIRDKLFSRAVDVYTDALKIKPQNTSITSSLLYNRAIANSKIGNFRSAVDDCNVVLTSRFANTEVLLLRAQCYYYLGKLELSKQDYEAAFVATKTNGDKKKCVEVQAKIDQTNDEISHKLAEQKNALGMRTYKCYKYQLALEHFSAAIDLWPDNVIFYHNRANCLFWMYEYGKSLSDSQQAVSIDKTFAKGHALIVQCNLHLGEFDAAEEALHDLAKHDPNYTKFATQCKKLRAFEKQTLNYFTQKDFKRSVYCVDDALKILPNCVKFKLMAAECYVELDEIEKVERIAQLWRPSNPSNADLRFIRSLLSYHGGNLNEALEHLEHGLASNPLHSKCISSKIKFKKLVELKADGDRSFELQNFTEAVDCYTEALQNESFENSFVFDLLYGRAKSYFKTGNLREAIDDCNRALDIQSGHMNVLLLRADCHRYLENFIESIVDYESFLLNEGTDELCRVNVETKLKNVKIELNHKVAERKGRAGDFSFKTKEYQVALLLYKKAVTLWPENAVFYGKRAVCYAKMQDYKSAIRESLAAVAIDKHFQSGYECMIKSAILIGEIGIAERAVESATSTGSKNSVIRSLEEDLDTLKLLNSNIVRYYRAKYFKMALDNVETALEKAPSSLNFKLLKAECLVQLNRFEEANNIAVSCMKSDSSNADAVYIRALCLYETNWEQGLQCLRNTLVLDPDHRKAKAMILKIKEFEQVQKKANRSFEEENYREARDHFTVALKITPKSYKLIPKLLYNLAFANSKIGNIRSAIRDCTNAMLNKQMFSSFLKLRADCFKAMRNFEKCVEDYENLLKIERSNEVENLLKEAKIALQRSQSDNFYDILDMNKNASKNEIKKAYKKLALIHHPDKHSDASNDEKLEQEEIFKKVNQAHDVLANEARRAAYDSQH